MSDRGGKVARLLELVSNVEDFFLPSWRCSRSRTFPSSISASRFLFPCPRFTNATDALKDDGYVGGKKMGPHQPFLAFSTLSDC